MRATATSPMDGGLAIYILRVFEEKMKINHPNITVGFLRICIILCEEE
jgi:hypothetical protein